MSSTKHTTGGTAKIATEHPIKAKIASSVVDCDSGKITEDEVVKHEPSSPVTRKAPFRFRWQKKLGNTGQPVAAAGNERFYSRPRTSTRRVANELKVEDNFEAEYQDDEDDEDGDEYFVGEDGCDSSIDINDQVEGGAKMSSGRGTDKSRANDGIASTLSSRPRPDKNDPARPQNNGRVFGRKLVPWHRKLIYTISSLVFDISNIIFSKYRQCPLSKTSLILLHRTPHGRKVVDASHV